MLRGKSAVTDLPWVLEVAFQPLCHLSHDLYSVHKATKCLALLILQATWAVGRAGALSSPFRGKRCKVT